MCVAGDGKSRIVKSVPRGTSHYQAAWIVDSDGEEHEEVVSVSDEGAGQWEEFEGSDEEDDSEIRSIVSN